MTQYKKQPNNLAPREHGGVRPVCVGVGGSVHMWYWCGCTLGGGGVDVNVWGNAWVYVNMGGCICGCVLNKDMCRYVSVWGAH